MPCRAMRATSSPRSFLGLEQQPVVERTHGAARGRARVTGLGTGYLACPNALEGRAPGEGTSSEANADSSGRLGRWASRTPRPLYVATPNARHEPALLCVGSMPWFGGCLQPATDRRLIGQVVQGDRA
jgi:hypothetical protein